MLQMKTFKQLFYTEAAAAPAQDYKVEKDDDEEVKGYKPRSKGEEEFANLHVVTKKVHPVAVDTQHSGGSKKGDPDHHTGGKKQAMGEDVKTMQKFSTFVGSK